MKENKVSEAVVYVDTAYLNQLAAVKRCFEACEEDIKVKYLYIQQKENDTKQWSQLSFESVSEEEEKPAPAALIYLGDPDSFVLNQILLQQQRLGITTVFTPESRDSLTPLTHLTSPLGNDTFMKRYLMIEKAKKASVFGVVVVNAAVHAGGKTCVRNLLDLLARHEKKAYVFTMNKLNEPKLKNFSEIEAFVVLSCPASSFFDYKDFYKTVLTPYELGIALGEFEWDSNIYFDKEIPVNKDKTDDETRKEREFELGRQLASVKQDRDLVLRSVLQTYDHYADRSYKGLDMEQDVPVHKAKLGRVGIAMAYKDLQEDSK
jgi:diphthamide biosynthesis protein 2